MTGKISTWWENSVRGNGKTAGKNSGMVGIFPQWEKKHLPVHKAFSSPIAPIRGRYWSVDDIFLCDLLVLIKDTFDEIYIIIYNIYLTINLCIT
jgi:hypothetical protein